MTNLLAEAINSDNPGHAAIIQNALGIESDEVNYFFPKEWRAYREQRARYIGNEARHLAS